MFETKVIVAPNSPSARAKDRIMPARMPGRISGSVIVAKIHSAFAPSVPAASSRRRSTASSDRRIERGTGPAEDEDDAESLGKKFAKGAPAPEQQQQEIAGDDRRDDERQVHDDVEQRLSPKLAARQQQGDRDADRQASEHRPERDPQ